MKIQQHAAYSIAISGILFLAFKSGEMAVSCLVTGVLIDLDHVVDYIFQGGRLFRIREFFQVYHAGQLLKVRIFHGWEWLGLLGAAAWMTEWNPWVVGAWIGFVQHLILDKINCGESFLCYSFLWRWKKGFKAEAIFKKSLERRCCSGKD
jgi:hypothetical protein